MASLVVCGCCGMALGLVYGCGGVFVLVFSYVAVGLGRLGLRCAGLVLWLYGVDLFGGLVALVPGRWVALVVNL